MSPGNRSEGAPGLNPELLGILRASVGEAGARFGREIAAAAAAHCLINTEGGGPTEPDHRSRAAMTSRAEAGHADDAQSHRIQCPGAAAGVADCGTSCPRCTSQLDRASRPQAAEPVASPLFAPRANALVDGLLRSRGGAG